MEKYFRTLDATRHLFGINAVSKGQRYIDKHELRKSMASALRRHHDVGAEANYIINTYLDDSIKEKKYEDS
jgi:hypothetical protein|tara:strand:- start:1435 stop:1647 length:213 start_codon:yes stop_codon:yes gene_type:complete